MADSRTVSSGMGLCGWLVILFVGLKLTRYIDWSWWWVLAPLWVPWCLVGIALAVFLLGWTLVEVVKYAGRK